MNSFDKFTNKLFKNRIKDRAPKDFKIIKVTKGKVTSTTWLQEEKELKSFYKNINGLRYKLLHCFFIATKIGKLFLDINSLKHSG